jgi:putative flippase GtrA
MRKALTSSPIDELIQVAAQLVRFGAVGGLATLVHVGFFTLGIELFGFRPMVSNLVAFCLAVIVSFIGHFWWTFRHQPAVRMKGSCLPWAAFFRFTVVAVTGLALNSLAVFLVVNQFNLSYGYACVLMITAVPFCTFMLSKFWAFS